ncbi:MAG TPA: hypothetical protein DEQ30_15405 [Porphyromonadaceae bacterium]|nr:hypothetical protein [Porphyromonadaceae bacterium]
MNDTMNQKEKVMGFIYVFLLFASVTAICCLLLFYYNSDYKVFAQKDFAIYKMDRIREHQEAQSKVSVVVDSLYNKINHYNPGVQAVYEENDIKFMINTLKNVYEEKAWDVRYKSFYHIAEFYSMWFIDKKDLWGKQENIRKFKKNLEECEVGLLKNKNDLNASLNK